MLKKLMKKEEGFTLAELLIVVAIIAVLVAISIPIFTSQLEKSREATDMSNVRAALAEVTTEFLTNGGKAASASVTAKQQQTSWQNAENGTVYTRVNGSEKPVSFNAVTVGGNYSIGIDTSGDIHIGAGAAASS